MLLGLSVAGKVSIFACTKIAWSRHSQTENEFPFVSALDFRYLCHKISCTSAELHEQVQEVLLSVCIIFVCLHTQDRMRFGKSSQNKFAAFAFDFRYLCRTKI